MPDNLQDETNDLLTENALAINRYAFAQRKQILAEINAMLLEIRATLLDGPEEVTMPELRAMITKSTKMFREGYKIIRANIKDDNEELLLVELQEGTKQLQKLVDNYDIPYSVREPSFVLTNRNILDTPIEGILMVDWLTAWGNKTNSRLKAGLFSEYAPDKNRTKLVNDIFGTSKNPLAYTTFNRAGVDMNALLLSAFDATASGAATGIAKSNSSIIEGVIWNSCLCSTTCASCASLHNAVRYYNGPDETDGNEIPLHPNCLCFWSYKYKNPKTMPMKVPSKALSDITSQKEPKKWAVWYNSVSEQRKIDLLGKAKYRMLESGEVTLNQLLSKSNRREYTLAELSNKGYRVPVK